MPDGRFLTMYIMYRSIPNHRTISLLVFEMNVHNIEEHFGMRRQAPSDAFLVVPQKKVQSVCAYSR